MRPVRFVVAFGAVASCAVYDSSLLLDGGASDGGAEASLEASADAGGDVDTCAHAEPPARPAADDPSDGGDLELVMALKSVDFALANDAGAPYGFDLDHTCTCPGPETCAPASGAKPHCDEEGGRDNAGGALLQQFSQLTNMIDTSTINTRIASGAYTMLVRVRGYNGAPNDTHVSVAVFASTGTVPLDDAGNDPTPKHDGTDDWAVDPNSVVGTPPPYVAVNEDDAAYVASGIVVASVAFPLAIGAGFGSNFLRIDGALLSGPLTKTAAGWSLHGVISGRWDTRNILTGMQSVHDPFNSKQYLCGSNATYQVFKASICGAADIASNATNDNTNAPCNALSLAFGFDSEPAQFGGLLSGGTASSPCGSAYSDQCDN